jgi:enoyl-CoA hydratase/carnithine racemase
MDISYLQNPDISQLKELWSLIQECWLKLYGSSFPVAIAADGRAVAGGCYFLMSSEYRVMTAKSEMGVNVVTFGIPVPSLIIKVICNLISRRQAEIALTTAKIFTAQEAHNIGLIDEIATDYDDAIAKCEAFLEKFKNLEPKARSLTKQRIRQSELNYMRNNKEEDLNEFIEAATGPEVQRILKTYNAFLSQT